MARLCKQLFQKALFPVEENGDVYDRCTYEEALRQAWNDDGGEGASPEDQMPLADRAQRDGLRSPTPPSDDELEKAEGELLTSGVEVADNEHYSSGRDTLEEEGGTAGDAFAVRIEDRKMWFHSDNDNRTASPMPKGTQEGRRGSMHTNEGSDMEISFPERTPTHEVKRRLLCSSEESHQAVESTSAAVSSLYAKFGKADAGGNQGARTGAPEGGEVGVARVTTDNGKEKEDRADKGASVEEPEEPVRALALKEKAGKQDRGREKGEESDAHKGGHRREEQHRNSSTTDPDARGQSGKGAHDDRKEVEQGRSREEQNATYGQQEESKKANKKKRKAEKTNKQASGESFLDIDGDEGEDNEVVRVYPPSCQCAHEKQTNEFCPLFTDHLCRVLKMLKTWINATCRCAQFVMTAVSSSCARECACAHSIPKIVLTWTKFQTANGTARTVVYTSSLAHFARRRTNLSGLTRRYTSALNTPAGATTTPTIFPEIPNGF